MATTAHAGQFERFMDSALADAADRAVLKIVCFDEIDLAWAIGTARISRRTPISLGRDARAGTSETAGRGGRAVSLAL